MRRRERLAATTVRWLRLLSPSPLQGEDCGRKRCASGCWSWRAPVEHRRAVECRRRVRHDGGPARPGQARSDPQIDRTVDPEESRGARTHPADTAPARRPGDGGPAAASAAAVAVVDAEACTRGVTGAPGPAEPRVAAALGRAAVVPAHALALRRAPFGTLGAVHGRRRPPARRAGVFLTGDLSAGLTGVAPEAAEEAGGFVLCRCVGELVSW